MFQNLSTLALQQYWWAIISLLAGLLVFLLFVQGGQTLILFLGKSELQRKMLANAFGRKWEFTFTTLVTFGGAFFASFPLFYSTSFGGAYWVWMAILFCFILQAVSYEFRSKPNNVFGQRTYDIFLLINGAIGTVLIGTVVGTFFTGSNFVVSDLNFSSWSNHWYGLEALTNPHNLALGLSVFALSRILAIQYIHQNIDEPEINERVKNCLLVNTLIFLIVFLYWLIKLFLISGFSYDPETFIVSTENFKYFNNLLAMPVNTILLFTGIVLVLYGTIRSNLANFPNAIWYSGIGTVMTIFAIFILAGFNHTCFYPSLVDMQSSLTIQNSSSSHYTLTTMSYVSLLVPFIFAYIFFAWRSINDKKIDKQEMESDTHTY